MQIDRTISEIEVERPPARALADIGNAIADFWVPHESVAFLRMVISECMRFPDLGESYFVAGRNPARRAVVQYLRELHDSKAVNIPDPDLAAAQFIGLILDPLLLWARVMVGATARRQNGEGSSLMRLSLPLSVATDLQSKSEEFMGGYDIGFTRF